jgi:hypothetical protein
MNALATKEITFLKEHNLDSENLKSGDKRKVIATHADELIKAGIARCDGENAIESADEKNTNLDRVSGIKEESLAK